MPTPNKSIFEAIADFIPAGQKEEYWRFVAHIEKLPKDDEILRCVQAMGVFAIVALQVPGAVAAQLKVFKSDADSLIEASRRQSDRAAWVLNDSLAKLTSLLDEVTTRDYIYDLTAKSMSHVDACFKSILNRLPREQMIDFTANFEVTADRLTALKFLCEATDKKVEGITSQFDRELTKMLSLKQQLNVAISESLKTRISFEQARRQWPWMAAAIGACLITATVCWFNGKWYQRFRDRKNAQFAGLARREVVLKDTRDRLILVMPLSLVDTDLSGTYNEGGKQTLHLVIRK